MIISTHQPSCTAQSRFDIVDIVGWVSGYYNTRRQNGQKQLASSLPQAVAAGFHCGVDIPTTHQVERA